MKIRYYGHNGIQSGYGRAADEMVEALAAAGADLEVRPMGDATGLIPITSATSRFFKRHEDLTPHPDAIIIHTLPLGIDRVLAEIDVHAVDAPTVAYTTWEAYEVPPRVAQAVRGVDQLWVPSRATMHAFDDALNQSDVDRLGVHVVPHAYDDTRDHLYIGDRPPAPFTFYYVGAWTARKNPAGLLRAFMHTFTKSEDVRLILHCRGVERDQLRVAMFQTGVPQEDWPDIQFSGGDLAEPELRGVHATGDVFVSASRGEAWNLPAFEAMLAGKHAIVPARQGSDEFLEDTSAMRYASSPAPAMVDIRPLPRQPDGPPGAVHFAQIGAQGLDARCLWQEPNLDQLGSCMRTAFEGKVRSIEVHYDVAATFGREAVGQRAINLLEEIKKP